MKTFWITLVSLFFVGGLYAQDEAVNDTVYLTFEGDYGEFSIGLFQLPSTWSLYVDWGNGRIDYESHMSWPDYVIGTLSTDYAEPGKYQIKLFSESGDIKSKLFHLGLRQRAGFTSLDVSDCTALQYLDCGNNSLTSLDISGCSALDTLNCSSIQLTSLDVSGCTALQYLNCSFNQLTSLDVSGCTALQYLNCSFNQLTSLDVSGCTALQYLTCSSNQLTSLDVSGCSALDTLDCTSNQLTSLDVSQNTALEVLACGSNQLMSLDVSGCASLAYLDCTWNQLTSLDVSQNTALAFLVCGFNQLTSLDVSQNTALKSLDCAPNQLTSLDVSGNAALTRLSCADNQLASLDVSQNTALAFLVCGYNQLTSLDVSQNTALKSLDCAPNQLTSLDVSQNTALEVLACGSNQLTSLDVSQNTALASLDCGSNQLTSLDLSMNTSLRSFSCGGNRMAVVLDELGRFDLSALMGFEVDRAKDWRNGVLSGNMLEFQQGFVSYAYATNNPNPKYAFVNFRLWDNSPVAIPTISVDQNSHMKAEIALSTMTPDATIFYTTDGSEPTELSQQYEIPIEVKSSPLTIKAITVKEGKKSRVATATFSFPGLPNESALSTTTLRVYAQDRTIYLSEPAGEVEVFTTSGRRVYRGVSTAIPVPRPGVYVVTAAGQKYKVGVK